MGGRAKCIYGKANVAPQLNEMHDEDPEGDHGRDQDDCCDRAYGSDSDHEDAPEIRDMLVICRVGMG